MSPEGSLLWPRAIYEDEVVVCNSAHEQESPQLVGVAAQAPVAPKLRSPAEVLAANKHPLRRLTRANVEPCSSIHAFQPAYRRILTGDYDRAEKSIILRIGQSTRTVCNRKSYAFRASRGDFPFPLWAGTRFPNYHQINKPPLPLIVRPPRGLESAFSSLLAASRQTAFNPTK